MTELSFDTKFQGTSKVKVGQRVRVALEVIATCEGKAEEKGQKYFKFSFKHGNWVIPEQSILAINNLAEPGNSYGLADRIQAARSVISNLSSHLAQIMGDDQQSLPLMSSAHSPNVAQHVTTKNLPGMEDLQRDLHNQTKTIAELQSKVKRMEEENATYKNDAANLKEAQKRIVVLEKEAEAQKKEAEKQIKKLQSTIQALDKKKPTKEQSQVSPSPPPQRFVTIHYDTSQKFPLVDDVESCLVQAQQNTFYQFKRLASNSSPGDLFLYFDIVEDRIREVEAKKELAKSLLAKTNNNCVWVFVCFKPSEKEEATKIAGSIKGLASGLILPDGQFAQVYLTAEYQIKSNQRDKQGNFLHVIANKDEFKQKILSLANMKVTGAPVNLPGIVMEPMPSAPMNHVPMNPGPMNPGPMNHVPMNPGPMNHVPMNPGPMNHVPMNPGPMNSVAMNPGPMNPGPMNPGPSTSSTSTTPSIPRNSVPTPYKQAEILANMTNSAQAQNYNTALAPVNNANSEVVTQQVQYSSVDTSPKIASKRLQGSTDTVVTLTLANGKSIQLFVKEVPEPSAPIANVQTGHTRSISSGTASIAMSMESPESNAASSDEAKVHTDIVSQIIGKWEQQMPPSTSESSSVPLLSTQIPVVEAKNMYEDWEHINSDSALQDVTRSVEVQTTEFRVREKLNEEDAMDTSPSEPGPGAVTESGSAPETSK